MEKNERIRIMILIRSFFDDHNYSASCSLNQPFSMRKE